MVQVPLTSEQQELKDQLTNRVDRILELSRANGERSEIVVLWDEIADIGIRLHNSLARSGHLPIHNKYLIKNRNVSQGTREFYHHVHSAQSLLRCIESPLANIDPSDQTIGDEFVMPVYSRRWEHTDSYKLKRTATGWDVTGISDKRSCGKDCKGLLQSLGHDAINYPADIPSCFEALWSDAAEYGMTHDSVQTELNRLTDWINTCEKATPVGRVIG